MAVAIHNAFVLGAGLGTRLRGLTARRPKPLIPVCNKPLITFALDHLLDAGVKNFVINTHHCAEVFDEFFPKRSYRGAPIHFEHEPVLLETAGGIKNVERHLRGAPFIVYNGDILANLPLASALAHHAASANEVTLVLRSHGGPLHIALDEKSGRVLDIHRKLGTSGGREFLFTGIYLLEPEFFSRVPAETKISVIPVFLEMIRAGAKIGGIVIDDGEWFDLGTREKYLDVHKFFHREARQARDEKKSSFENRCGSRDFCGSPLNGPVWIDASAQVSPGAQLRGATAIGAGAKIGEGAVLTDCIVWEKAEIGIGSCLENCIVTAAQRVSGTHRDTDF